MTYLKISQDIGLNYNKLKMYLVENVTTPPNELLNLAAELAAAITDGSSPAIGILIYRLFILKNNLS